MKGFLSMPAHESTIPSTFLLSVQKTALAAERQAQQKRFILNWVVQFYQCRSLCKRKLQQLLLTRWSNLWKEQRVLSAEGLRALPVSLCLSLISPFIVNRHYRNFTGRKGCSCSVRSKQFTLSASSYILNSHVLISLATWHSFYDFFSYSWNLPGKTIWEKKSALPLLGEQTMTCHKQVKACGFPFILGPVTVHLKMGYGSIFFPFNLCINLVFLLLDPIFPSHAAVSFKKTLLEFYYGIHDWKVHLNQQKC